MNTKVTALHKSKKASVEERFEKIKKHLATLAKMPKGKMRVKTVLKAITKINAHGLITFAVMSDDGQLSSTSLVVKASLSAAPDIVMNYAREHYPANIAESPNETLLVFVSSYRAKTKREKKKAA